MLCECVCDLYVCVYIYLWLSLHVKPELIKTAYPEGNDTAGANGLGLGQRYIASVNSSGGNEFSRQRRKLPDLPKNYNNSE